MAAQHRAPRAAIRAGALLIAALGLTGCFEDPIAESLRLTFLPGHTVKVAVRVLINDPGGAPEALKRRLADTRRELLAGDDPWSERFHALAPAAERRIWNKSLGELRSVTHEALLDEPRTLEKFFADTALAVAWREADGRAEFTIEPLRPSRASSREAALVDGALENWSNALARYFERVSALYALLDRHPERARACLGKLFEGDLDEATAAGLSELAPEEAKTVSALEDAMKEASAVLLVGEGEARSLDEMSHRVFDPFPAAVTVDVPGTILEVEGFRGATAGAPRGAVLRVRGLGLWDALADLHGEWVAPDPLLLHVAHQRAGDARFDLDAVTRAACRAATPSAEEIRTAITNHLRPEPVYRVAWSTQGLPASPEAALRDAWRETD